MDNCTYSYIIKDSDKHRRTQRLLTRQINKQTTTLRRTHTDARTCRHKQTHRNARRHVDGHANTLGNTQTAAFAEAPSRREITVDWRSGVQLQARTRPLKVR